MCMYVRMCIYVYMKECLYERMNEYMNVCMCVCV